ncbi:MAG: NfeD family protein [Promicromonosporaceae bacterium]|nr:NfeD family protein [Promicromonosporaceae bacterium]
MDWLWWIGAALSLGLIEVFVLDPVIFMFIGGALAGALAAALGAPIWLQVVVAVVTTLVLLATAWPWAKRQLKKRVPLQATNADAQVGRTAVVVAEVSAAGGRIKLTGEVWTARLDDDAPAEPLPVGTKVTVRRIDGATAVVEQLPSTTCDAPRSSD